LHLNLFSFLNDDLGQKRLLYERLGVQEYWVVNIENRTTYEAVLAKVPDVEPELYDAKHHR